MALISISVSGAYGEGISSGSYQHSKRRQRSAAKHQREKYRREQGASAARSGALAHSEENIKWRK